MLMDWKLSWSSVSTLITIDQSTGRRPPWRPCRQPGKGGSGTQADEDLLRVPAEDLGSIAVEQCAH